MIFTVDNPSIIPKLITSDLTILVLTFFGALPMRKLCRLFSGLFAYGIVVLGAIGFLSYSYVDTPAPDFADEPVMTRDLSAEGGNGSGVALVDVSISNPHQARDSIC